MAFLMTGTGIGIDLTRADTLTRLFLVFYAVGCVAAVLAVARRSIFTAMVQPPLILAVAVPLVVRVLGGGSTGGGLRNTVLELGLPLVNGFPTMAVTTVVTVVLGLVRMRVQRRAHPPTGSARRVPPPAAYDRGAADRDGVDQGSAARRDPARRLARLADPDLSNTSRRNTSGSDDRRARLARGERA